MPPQSLATDLSILPASNLTDRGLTSHMASRYHQGLPYATISTGVLIAFNTFSTMDLNQEQIYQDLAARIYNRLCKRGESQVILLLGESGSGKSEYRASLTNHLLTLANNPLSGKIKSANHIFQAFTTAKTAAGLYTSRAGYFLELQYGSDATLVGASLLDYRLERPRMTKIPTGERNFNIFYYLLCGLSPTEMHHLALENVASKRYRYLGHHSQLKVGIDDANMFNQFKTALKSLEFSKPEIANICQILAAILHIGQLSFQATGADDNKDAAIEVSNTDVLYCISDFLGVRAELLESTLSYKTVTIGIDRVTLVLDQKGARENADELARTLYSLLFAWIMERVNSKLSRSSTDSLGISQWDEGVADPVTDSFVAHTISIVDFPGFTVSSTVPTLDKLLHNSANEALYNYMLRSYFDYPLEKLGSEEITVPATEFYDNSDTVKELLHPSLGLLSLVDEQSKREGTDKFLLDSVRSRFMKSSVVETISARASFSVRHFAGEVEYSVEGLVNSNIESISGDIISLFTSSSSSDFLKGLFSASAIIDTTFGNRDTVVEAHLSSKPMRQPSVIRKSQAQKLLERQEKEREKEKEKQRKKKKKNSHDAAGQFTAALEGLIDSFEGANPYFIICLKPNDHKLTNSFDARCVRQQIKAFGIPEIAKRVKLMDYSVFLTFNEFISCCGADGSLDEIPGFNSLSVQDQVAHLLSTRSWPERDANMGLSGVFMSENAWLQLIDPRMSFAESAQQKFLTATDSANPFRDDDNNNNNKFYYDLDSKSISGATLGGDMFKAAQYGVNKEAYIHSKPFGDDEEDSTELLTVTGARKRWMFLVYLFTWFTPDFFIKNILRVGRDRPDIRVAWREKLAINLMIWLTCCACVLFLIGFPILICPIQNVMTTGELSGYSYSSNPSKTYTSIRGVVYDITNFANTHYPRVVSSTDILNYGGTDSSDLFPIQLSAACNKKNGDSLSDYIVYGSTTNYTDTNAKYHDFRYFTNDSRPDWYLQQMYFFNRNYKKSYIGYTKKDIKKKASSDSLYVASLHGYVYDFTDYINGVINVKAPAGKSVPSNIDKNFMETDVVNLFLKYSGEDVTNKFDELGYDVDEKFEIERCLRNVFMIGKLDTRDSAKCVFARYFLLAITIFVVLIIIVKFLAALQFGRGSFADDPEKFFICQIPAYTEDEDSLRRAIDSLARTTYDDKRKLLLVVCDGMIVGSGNDRPTPRIVLDILGSPPDENPEALSFESLGEGSKQHNKAKVYTGLYEVHGHIVPYMVIVKVGTPEERNRPGNRGKRDSQMILMRFLNRVHHNLPMSPLELEMYHQMQNIIGVSPTYYEYLLQVDADTVVHPDAPRQFVSSMLNDTKLQAVCGETALSNANSSVITMIQVYEYYISHNLVKAFESLFGSVTCLPGCFSMYRIYEADSQKPLFVSHPIIKAYSENRVDTLHMKNLLHLGEDRYLTTLLLKFNPKFKTKFLRHALAWTIAPDKWSILLSQRRRWINSTVHNLVELVPMAQMCGFCCFSMRFIVMIDLFSTIIQPVTVAYLAYLFYLCATETNQIPITSIVLLASIYGLQALIFLLRRRWEMIGWMLVYILAIPIFSLALPLYSFWYMDDFSWGNTRVIQGENGKKTIVSDAGKFDPSEIPLQRWDDYQSDLMLRSDKALDDLESTYDQKTDVGSLHRSGSHYTMRSSPPKIHRASSSVGLNTNDDYEMSYMNQGNEQYGLLGPTDEELTEAIRDILATADLMQVTKKSIRQKLEQQFNCKLSGRKDYINYIVEAILTGDL